LTKILKDPLKRIKCSKDTPPLDLFDYDPITSLENAIKIAEQKVLEENFREPEEIINDRLLKARSKVVVDHYEKVLTHLDYVEKNYPTELAWKRKNRYPVGWMNKDPKIKCVLDRFPKLVPLLNFLFNINRYSDTQSLDKNRMKKLLIGIKYKSSLGEEHQYSTFTTNAKFYEDMTKTLDCSKITAQKYLQELSRIEVIIEVGKDSKYGKIYADGYFMESPDGRKVKRPILTKNRHLKVLRTFSPTFHER
jgi:hypothetical protein